MKKVGALGSAFLPKEVTAGQLAELIGASERMVRGRISDGRLPRADSGHINLREIVQAGLESLATQQRRRGQSAGTGMRPGEACDALLRLGIWLMAQLTPEVASRAARRVGISEIHREALFDALLTDMPTIANTVLFEMQVSHGEAGQYQRMDHLEHGRGGDALYAAFLDD